MSSPDNEHPYAQLTPDFVLDAVESIGLFSDSRILSLNSYENRVYQVGIEDGTPIIAKFYRPQRWTTEAILEEHEFTRSLLENDISVVPPMLINGSTLHDYQDFRFALFKRQGGYAPEIEIPDTLYRIGCNIGRIHQVSNAETFKHRQNFCIENWAIKSRQFLLDNDFLSRSLRPAYETLSQDLIDKMQHIWKSCPFNPIKLHGDCHIGNILWREDQAHFVDFDDCLNGPVLI
ncbi:serine/threonine protein kinase [Oleiphilus sp. HI0086]|uniref:serine/threonine protein kinase n=1 Tax=Oleiphilus sp. HI0086 TaxID=1822260 RepID=UPI0007C2B962|nr:serine/threonine protein kinase [Oleiphilus sp. HI0086]KZZ39341.1 hypothetical protein A3756_23200 [Oleiphilus sp. HI0086]